MVAAAWAIPLAQSLTAGVDGVDSTWYHLPQSANFVITGSVWDLHFTDPYFLNWYYPANSELLHAVPLLAYDRDWLSPLVNHAFLALGLLAAWCIGRPWGLGPATLIAAAIVFGAEMMLDFQPGEARNDALGLAFFLAAVAIVTTAISESRALKGSDPLSPRGSRGLTPSLVVAGLAAGLAVGTKLTMLAPVAALLVGVAVLAGRGRRLRGAAVFLAAVFAGGGFWYVRNLVHSGNPLPWIDSLGPISLPAPEVALELRPPFSVAHYLTDTQVWRDFFFPGLTDSIGPLWPLVLTLILTAAIVPLAWAFLLRVAGRGGTREAAVQAGEAGGSPPDRTRGRNGVVPRLLAVLGGVTLFTLAAYIFTPLTASGPEGVPEGFVWNLRYIAPALALGLILVPLLPFLRGRRASLAVAVALFAILALQAAQLQAWDFGHRAWALGSGLAVLAAFALAWLIFYRETSWRPPRAALAAAGAVLAALALGGGYVVQDRYMERRYASSFAGLHLDSAVAWANGLRDESIGTAGRGGVFFQYGFAGADSSNDVQWIGEPGPRGAWLPLDDCASWRRAVNDGGYRYVVTTYDRRSPGTDETSREREWIRRDPAATEILADDPVAVFELSGELDLDGCGAPEAAAEERPTGVFAPSD